MLLELDVINLGGGVQSTAMSLMAAEEIIPPMPDAAIFADTGWEPPWVYETVEYVREQVPFDVITVDAGVSLKDRTMEGLTRAGTHAMFDISVYVPGLDGGRHIITKRQCTKQYKIDPIQREVRRLLGVPPGRRVPRSIHARQWIGITVDEIHRMSGSRVNYVTHTYPLIDLGLSRTDCVDWLTERGLRIRKSSCIGCPYKSRTQWHELQQNHPELYSAAVDVEETMNSLPYAERFGNDVRLFDGGRLKGFDFGPTPPADDSETGECGGYCWT